MISIVRRVVGVLVLVASATTMVTVAAGSAAAEPLDCRLDRSWSGASAHCPNGDGTFILEVDCFGVSISGGQPFGPYYKSVTGYAGVSGQGRDPIFINVVRDCMNPLTLGQIGVMTDARITLVPTRPAPHNAYE